MTVAFYVRHDIEFPQPVWRPYLPEVFHFDQERPTKLTHAWQDFIVALNPGITGKGYRGLCRWNTAFTNGTGYDNPNGNIFADFINNRDTSAKPPVIDKVRVCGGAIIHGTLNGDLLTVETLNGNNPPPSLSWVLARPWLYFKALTVRADGSNGNFPYNSDRPVYFPLVASGVVTVIVNRKLIGKPYPYLKRVA